MKRISKKAYNQIKAIMKAAGIKYKDELDQLALEILTRDNKQLSNS
jgi:hypothetical protein